MNDGGSKVIDPKIFEYLSKPESERSIGTSSPEFDGPAEAVAMAKAEAASHAKIDAIFDANPVQPEQNKKRGFFSFLRRKPKDEIQKQLPAPKLFECGLCSAGIEEKYIFTHWYAAHTEAVRDDLEKVENNSPLRSKPKQRSMVFIVRRPNFPADSQQACNADKTVAEYFARVIVCLKQQHPEMRFQYLPVAIGGTCEYLKTLLVIAEWEEE